jgi:hypothetical protein
MKAISQREAIERLLARWLDHLAEHSESELRLADLFSRENIEAVRTLDLYSEHSPSRRARELHRAQGLARTTRGPAAMIPRPQAKSLLRCPARCPICVPHPPIAVAM